MAEEEGRTRRVVLYGNPVLRRRAREVTTLGPDVRRLLADLRATVIERDGLGLAANQIGEAVSVFIIDPRGADVDQPPYCIINPRVVAVEGSIEREEGCLSIPEIFEHVARPELVRITGLDEAGRQVEVQATGLLARAFMHETDHLSGRLFIDHLGKARRSLLSSRLREIQAREAAACA